VKASGCNEIGGYGAGSIHHNADGNVIRCIGIYIAGPFLELVSRIGNSSQYNHCTVGICTSSAQRRIIRESATMLRSADDRQLVCTSSTDFGRSSYGHHQCRAHYYNGNQPE
jgi:ApbE superfamily uncharacterized protein (UPF0280 family)